MKTFVTSFLENAKKYAENKAVADAKGCYTYKELDEKSELVAAEIVKRAGDAGTDLVREIENGNSGFRIGILLPRVKEFIAASVGILRAGCAYVPIDHSYPSERVRYILEDAGCQFLLTTHELYEKNSLKKILFLKPAQCIFIEDLLKNTDKPIVSYNLSRLQNDGLVLYTSGSTGKPKGVVHRQQIFNQTDNIGQNYYEMSAGETSASIARVTFIAFLVDTYSPLYCGGSVYIVSEEEYMDLSRLSSVIRKNGIKYMFMAPKFAISLFDVCPETNLKKVITAGEKLSVVPSSSAEFIEFYGSSETFLVLAHKVSKNDNPKLLGRPDKNCRVFLTDSEGNQITEPSVPGELCVAGDYLAIGYNSNSDETARSFVECPFDKSSAVMFKTGDMMAWDKDGNLEFRGRRDNMIKLNGYRVELEEVESVLRGFTGIKEAACAMNEIAGKGILGCYYSVDEKASDFNLENLKKYASEYLPAYMVPTVYNRLSELPHNQNGKLDRRNLPKLVFEAEKIVLPENETEEELYKSACEVLSDSKFGVTTSLLSAGLSSLSAMQFASRIQKKTCRNISASDILQLQTIRAIAGSLNKFEKTSALKVYPYQEFYPMTENQIGVYLDWERNRDSKGYNLPQVFRFTDKNAEKLAGAVEKAVNAHNYLKTRIVEHNGEVLQKPCRNEKPDIAVKNIDFTPDADFFKKLVQPFNLLKDRLYRITIFKSPEAVYLFADFYHIIYDGLSAGIFMRDVLAAYDGEELVPEKFTACDFALYEKEIESSDFYKKAEEYFDKLMADANMVKYPESDQPDGVPCGEVNVTVPAETIDRFCSGNGVTVSSYLQAAFAETLHRLTREENSFFVTVSNGRSASSELLNSTGMFVKTLPVVLLTESMKHGDETTVDYVKRMHQQLQETYSKEFYPYTRITGRSGLQAKVMFVYQGGVLDNNGPEQMTVTKDSVSFPLDVFAYSDSKGGYRFDFRYDGMIYGSEDIKQLASTVAVVARNMASAKLIKQIPLLDDTQMDAVLKLSKGEEIEFDTSKTWINLFLEQVRKEPERIAAADFNSSITYAELNRQSDSVAAYLMNMGVKPNDFVALKMDRVKEFVVAVLGIHKAGAAYVPIDIHYPQERIDYILNNSMARFTITEKAVTEAVEQNPDAKPVCLAKPDNYAYMIYTSGSTGLPKGALLHQRGLMNFTVATIKLNELTKDDRISCYRSFSFDAHIEDVFPVLATGASIHIMPEAIRKDLDSMYKFLMEHQITGGGYTTSIAKLLLTGYDLKQRFMTCGGEALTGVVSDKVQILNVYGPTECTDHISVMKLEKNRNYSTIPIGKPMANGYCFMVDKYGSLVPAGAAGELCYAGPQVGYGYWQLDEKTKEVFGDCPFVDGIRMYHTGDLARYNNEGNIEYLGRIDFQVKLRGFRIELGEVESRASQYKGVKQVIALVKNVGTSQNLCLYFTAETQVDKENLRSFMAETLTEYMVPTVFMQLDKMPMTPNGKINRKDLPEPKMDRKEGREPSTELESRLCAIFAEILGIDKVYADDSFFNIGGTSLSAMKVVMKSMNSGIKFVYSNIFDNPSPEALARFVENNSAPNAALEQNSNQVFAPKEESFADALKYNSMEYLEDITRSGIGKVLVTGANGFLGIHIVKKLIDKGCPTVYCLIRNSKNMSAESRLDMMFMYYFDETYLEMIGSRIKIVNGDITDKNLEETLKDLDYDTIINSAAIVKHFANDDRLDRVNFHGVENLIEICCRHNKKLVQISTTSVAGESVSDCVPQGFLMHENQHSFGQNLDNKYLRTKWQAEKAILGAVLNRGLRGKIIRVGNLMSRASDGEFQANFRSNNFMNKLKAYSTIGYLPMANIIAPTEFSPIDSTAEAVITLAGTPDKFTVFHAKNNHLVDMANVIDAMNACGLDIKIVKHSEFQKHFEEVMHDEKRNASISSLIAYLGNNSSRRVIVSNNTFTLAVLNILGFRWPIITEEYIEKAIKALKSMDFFD